MDAASTSQGLGSTMAEPVYIVSAARTAIGDFGGALKEFAPAELATRVIQEAVKRAGLQPGDVKHVVLGQVIPSEPHDHRSEEWRVGQECGSQCKYRWSPDH